MHVGFSVRKRKKKTRTQTPQPKRVRRAKTPPEQVREETNLPALTAGRKTTLQWNEPWRNKSLLEARRTKDREEEGREPASPGKHAKKQKLSLSRRFGSFSLSRGP
jgi:type IV secretory pathway VirB10-like protein